MSTNHPGLGVMLAMLGDNQASVDAIQTSLNHTILDIHFTESRLVLQMSNGNYLMIWDAGQSCCEHRYMTVNGDNLDYFKGATLLKVEVVNGAAAQDNYETHETQFLDIHTSYGMFQITTHNEHNGYYGGFALTASLTPVTGFNPTPISSVV